MRVTTRPLLFLLLLECATCDGDARLSGRQLTSLDESLALLRHQLGAQTGENASEYSASDFERLGCTPPRAFTRIYFDDALMVRSNLGGMCVRRTHSHALECAWSLLR